MRCLVLFCAAGLLFAQGTEPKKSADDYEVHAQAKNVSIGAEFTVHSYSRGEQMFIVPDFLVVEVAIFPPKGETYEVHDSEFTLRINGKKEVLHVSSPHDVVNEEKHPEWNNGSAVPSHGSAGPGFPSPLPGPGLPPRVEIPRDNPSGIQRDPDHPDELLMETALVEGPHHAPISGFIYFPYRGKTNAIKTLELLYGDTVLKLR